jgi:Icc-related predicted phosphoesterase
MKILAIADVHIDPDLPGACQDFIARVEDEPPDVLVVAGDLAVGKSAVYETLLAHCAFFTRPKLFVPGNHDLWQLYSKRATWQRYQQDLPDAVTAVGWHYLDLGPTLVGDVAFIGCLGWYDYSLRQTASPRPDLRVSPAQVTAPGRGMKVMAARAHVPWTELTDEDYAARALQVGDDNVMEGIVWNDAFYTDWGRSDAEMTQYFCDRLREQAQQVARRARQLVVITHFVPFAETLRDYTETGPAYARAFAGSVKLGETIQSLPHVRVAIFGHWHQPGRWQIGNLQAYNVSAKNGPAEGTLITLQD